MTKTGGQAMVRVGVSHMGDAHYNRSSQDQTPSVVFSTVILVHKTMPDVQEGDNE